MKGKFSVLVVGCNGKMGQIVCELVSNSEDMEMYAGFDKCARELPDFPVLETIEDLKDFVSENYAPNVIIDFSQPNATMQILKEISVPFYLPTVIATTGFTTAQLELINTYAVEKAPIFQSNNMSYEIKLLSDLLKEISPKLYQTHDIEIVEAHHNRKKDSPSGTALTLANAINESLDETLFINCGRKGKREPDEIGISSIRGGNIVGEHTVRFIGESDELEITHRAFSRTMFAEGALKAARFLIGKNRGKLYGMNDLQ